MRHNILKYLLALLAMLPALAVGQEVELGTLLDATNPDPAAVGAQAIAMHRSREAIRAAHDTFEDGIVAMLTETQRAQYEALREARPERGRFGRFHQPPGD